MENKSVAARMKQLRKHAALVEENAKKEKLNEGKYREELIQSIKELGPRIEALLDLMTEAVRLNIVSSRLELDDGSENPKTPNPWIASYKNPMEVGFCREIPYHPDNNYPNGMRIFNSEGAVDLFVLSDGRAVGRTSDVMVLDDAYRTEVVNNSAVPTELLEQFVREFAIFEQRFFDFIDNLEVE